MKAGSLVVFGWVGDPADKDLASTLFVGKAFAFF